MGERERGDRGREREIGRKIQAKQFIGNCSSRLERMEWRKLIVFGHTDTRTRVKSKVKNRKKSHAYISN